MTRRVSRARGSTTNRAHRRPKGVLGDANHTSCRPTCKYKESFPLILDARLLVVREWEE